MVFSAVDSYIISFWHYLTKWNLPGWFPLEAKQAMSLGFFIPLVLLVSLLVVQHNKYNIIQWNHYVVVLVSCWLFTCLLSADIIGMAGCC
jgi:hypothetical protein